MVSVADGEIKEIGGYFGKEITHGKQEYYTTLIALNTARNSLAFLIRSRGIDKLYIPYFLCDCIALLCEREKIEYECYHINENFSPIFLKKLRTKEYIYIVNYYGQISNAQIVDFKKKYNNIIIDNVQAFFQSPVCDVDTIYSCRKFLGVPDGSYLSTNLRADVQYGQDDSSERMAHILGRPRDGAAKHYEEFKAIDESFKGLDVLRMSAITHSLLQDIDYDYVKEKRNNNYKILDEAFKDINKLRLQKPIGPFAYPLFLQNGLQIKALLANSKVYVPTLWPNVLLYEDGLEKELASNILPLPCDQRYDAKEMQIIITLIEQLMAENQKGK